MAVGRKQICVCISIVVIVCIIITIIVVKHKPDKKYLRTAAVAADSKTCSDIGLEILKSGGSAVDGAIAALLCTSVVHPQSMGIGGGSIFTIMHSNGSVKIISGRETVPNMTNLTPHLRPDCTDMFIGPQWIGVPGELRAYEKVHSMYGKLPWSELFQPTIRLAREWVPISNATANSFQYLNNSSIRRLFMDENEIMLKEGDKVRFEKLAQTLEVVAVNGTDVFYRGYIGADLISDIQEAGGSLTKEDLQSFEALETDPWNVTLGDYTMYFPPPPAGGALVGFILNVMKGYELNPKSLEREERVQTYHRFIETLKFANCLREHVRDPNYYPNSTAYKMIQEKFAEEARRKISNTSTIEDQYCENLNTDKGTTHLSVIDEDGMIVSVTSSINAPFGSQVFSPKTGIILNNQLADFCERKNKSLWSVGEKPPSSMSPAILRSRDDKRTLAIGGEGGTMIPSAVSMALMNYLWFGKSLNESIDTPIIYVQQKNATLSFESDDQREFDQDVINALKKIGHQIEENGTFYNVVQAVFKQDGECAVAVSDKRKNGKAAAYCI